MSTKQADQNLEMRVIGPATEDEMVLAFLRAEIESSRFAADLLAALADLGLDRTLVDQADLSDPEGNARRRQVLEDYRGPRRGPAAGIFGGFPDDVSWSWAALTPAELADVRYIHWEYWLEASGGTRRPADAIARMRATWDVPDDDIRQIADALALGSLPLEIVVVGLPPGRGLVVLEGHVRLTGLLLRPELLPSEVRVLLGSSPRIAEWSCYGSP
jgi:hypothetical protein